MINYRDYLNSLVEQGEAFTYQNFAEHGEPQPDSSGFRVESRWGIEAPPKMRTWPKHIRPEFESWRQRCRSAIERADGIDHPNTSRAVELCAKRLAGFQESDFHTVHRGLLGMVTGIRDEIDAGVRQENSRQGDTAGGLPELRLVLGRFHQVVVQLRRRREDRPTLEVGDEYDVQDLLHALLRLHFDDIRPEEWTPSYAGSSARMDFLLKKTGIVIEVKKTRHGLADRQVSKELIDDIAHYGGHADCTHLVCFVYDPEERITNPTGLKADLENQSRDGLAVEVVICSR